jgi:large subunit ribosomal protein L4
MSSSPLWRGGGRIFPNSPDENFTHKVNKKMYRAGVCSILSQLAREGRLSVVEDSPSKPRRPSCWPKSSRAWAGIGAGHHRQPGRKPVLASRNLPNVLVVEPRQADPVSLVFFKKVLITKPALAKIEEMLA